jgi:metallo-beta-lactamase family protein
MKLSFYGADNEVTGSCHGVEIGGRRILIDCGLVQGAEEKNGQEFPFNPVQIDAVVITHAHIDHSGRLPLLVKQGFKGKIFATAATIRLMDIMLRDSAHIQEQDVEWKNRKGRRSGEKPAEPLYTLEDAQSVFKYVVPCNYAEVYTICEGATFRFRDAGHLLGSASVEMWLTEGNVTKKVVFSGDIGNFNLPIIRDPQYIDTADIVVMEGTYGDRSHDAAPDYAEALAEIIDKTLAQGGNVIIPSFAVGRTQELLYYLREIKERGLVKSRPDFPVYVDSPLSTAATAIFEGELEEYLDDESLALVKAGKRYISFEDLRFTQSTEESKQLNTDPVPKVIISSSGMCEAGRVRHHLKHNLWRRESAVVFVGYQARGTLGRILLDQAVDYVKLFGESIAIRCAIYNLQGLSSHADREGLIKWLTAMYPKPEKVFIVHCDEDICSTLTGSLRQMGYDVDSPDFTAVYDIPTGRMILQGIDKAQRRPEGTRKAALVYQQLLAAGTRLLDVIAGYYGGANKDLTAFTQDIEKLVDKWEK